MRLQGRLWRLETAKHVTVQPVARSLIEKQLPTWGVLIVATHLIEGKMVVDAPLAQSRIEGLENTRQSKVIELHY
jgi:hypothetical protein